jgi:hypothetical protein
MDHRLLISCTSAFQILQLVYRRILLSSVYTAHGPKLGFGVEIVEIASVSICYFLPVI